MSNSAKGRESKDSVLGGSLVAFFNRNSTTYPVEVGGPKFDLVPVNDQKDQMINIARLQAEQEYNRIMELVVVLQKQAESIKRRLDLTDMIHKAKYNFKIIQGNCYWLIFDRNKNITRLSMMAPEDWGAGPPDHYEYICRVRCLGDYTWQEIDKEGNNVN